MPALEWTEFQIRFQNGSGWTLKFSGKNHTAHANSFGQTLQQASASWMRALQSGDQAALQTMDPFDECVMSGRWQDPATPRTEPWWAW